MKIRVNLYGTLSKAFPEYNHSDGMEVQIPDGIKVKELLSILDIPDSAAAVVAMEGRIVKEGDTITKENVDIFQAMHGG